MAVYDLPAGIEIPSRYKRTTTARRYFIEGAQDAQAGRSGYDQESLVQHQGAAAWQAYQDGRQAWARLKEKGDR